MRLAPAPFSIVLPLALSFAVGALARPSAARAADEKGAHPNPDYAAWAALDKGSWVKVRIEGSLRRADWTLRLAEVTPGAAVLDVAETRFDGPARAPWQERVAAAAEPEPAKTAPEPAKAGESGEATVTVGDQAVACRWETRRRRDADGGESGDTTWTSPDVPGFVKRVSWLAADRRAGLPAAKTVETVVGFELRPRPAGAAAGAIAATGPATATRPAGTADKVRRAGEAAGPSRFQWTYGFEPRGWRRWERTGPGTWIERWQTGEEVRFRIDRHLVDDERAGVVVRRLPDEDLETIIPDAGKGAKIWFRHLPDGQWTILGEVETAE